MLQVTQNRCSQTPKIFTSFHIRPMDFRLQTNARRVIGKLSPCNPSIRAFTVEVVRLSHIKFPAAFEAQKRTPHHEPPPSPPRPDDLHAPRCAVRANPPAGNSRI